MRPTSSTRAALEAAFCAGSSRNVQSTTKIRTKIAAPAAIQSASCLLGPFFICLPGGSRRGDAGWMIALEVPGERDADRQHHRVEPGELEPALQGVGRLVVQEPLV